MCTLAIVIVNYKMADFFRPLLASLKEQMENSDIVTRIIVVDNNSNDCIDEVVAHSGLTDFITTIYQKVNCGYASGVNAGIKSISAEYYFVINPDIVFFEEHTLKRLCTFMDQHQEIGMAAPKLLNDDGSLQFSCWRFPRFLVPLYRRTRFGNTFSGKSALSHFLMHTWQHNETLPVDCLMGSAMFVRASVLPKVGLMSEDYFMYFEDMDWCQSFWEKHIPIYYVHDIRLRHGWQRDSAKILGLKSLFLNHLTRIHVKSWLKYMKRWRAHL